jgi:hypothetical protein
MTSANPAFDADFSATDAPVESDRPRRRGGGKRFFKLMVIATAVGFVVAKVRGHSTPLEADYGD